MTYWISGKSRGIFSATPPRFAGRFVVLLLWLAITSCGKDNERKSAEARPRTHAYVYNDRVLFGYGGQAERFQIEGWSGMEQDFTWTNGPIASLGFRLLEAKGPVMLRVKMSAHISPPDLPFQPVDVVLVETFAQPPYQQTIARWIVAEEKTFTAMVPPEFVARPETITRLEFHIPKATSAAELGHGGVRRSLGLRVVELTFEQTKRTGGDQKTSGKNRRPFDLEYGEKVFFSTRGDAERLQVKGWSLPEQEYTWTEGTSAMIGLRLQESKIPVTLSVRTAGINSPPKVPFQPVDVMIGDEKIAHWDVADEATFTAAIPQQLTAARENIVFIEFRIPVAISPALLGQGKDSRQLGLRVRDLTVEQTPQLLNR